VVKFFYPNFEIIVAFMLVAFLMLRQRSGFYLLALSQASKDKGVFIEKFSASLAACCSS
jgi:hypothetical protein